MRNGNESANGRYVYDPASSLSLHVGHDLLNQIQGSPGVYGHGALKLVQGHVFERPDLDDPCQVDEHVNATTLLVNVLNGLTNLTSICNVASKSADISPILLEQLPCG